MVWSPGGLDPIPRDFIAVAVACAVALPFLGLYRTAILGASAVLIDLLWWSIIIGSARGILRGRHTESVRPAVIIYVPGLNDRLSTTTTWSWLFGGGVEPRVVIVPPPALWLWDGNLGDERYVEAVRREISKVPAAESRRIALVGSSRGAGVVLRTMLFLYDPSRIMAAVMMNGPFTNITDVCNHRYPAWLAPLVIRAAPWLYSPLRLDDLAPVPGLPPLLFVTSKGDTNLPPAGVRHMAEKHGGRLLELGPGAPHSLLLAPLEEKIRLQDWIVEQMTLPLKL